MSAILSLFLYLFIQLNCTDMSALGSKYEYGWIKIFLLKL